MSMNGCQLIDNLLAIGTTVNLYEQTQRFQDTGFWVCLRDGQRLYCCRQPNDVSSTWFVDQQENKKYLHHTQPCLKSSPRLLASKPDHLEYQGFSIVGFQVSQNRCPVGALEQYDDPITQCLHSTRTCAYELLIY